MTRSNMPTLLSLDRFSKIMGINPVHFSGCAPVNLADGRTLFPIGNTQNLIWPQFSWQNADQVSREDLAREIWVAEKDIEGILGYHLAPTFDEEDIYQIESFHRPELYCSVDASGLDKSILLRNKKFIGAGRRAVTKLDTVTVVYSDPDGDGFNELATITLDLTGSVYATDEVRVYIKDKLGNSEWEIKSPISKKISSSIFTATYHVWQMIDPTLYDAFPSDEMDYVIDMTDSSNLVSEVDIYREYLDFTQSSASFIYNDPLTGEQTVTTGFIFQRKPELGEVVPMPATYGAAGWEISYPTNYPNYVKMWYYSGNQDNIQGNINGDYLSEYLATTIAYVAVSRLEKVYYSNNNAQSLADELRKDMAISEKDEFKFYDQKIFQNPLGTKVGEIRAWQRLIKLLDKKIGVAVV